MIVTKAVGWPGDIFLEGALCNFISAHMQYGVLPDMTQLSLHHHHSS